MRSGAAGADLRGRDRGAERVHLARCSGWSPAGAARSWASTPRRAGRAGTWSRPRCRRAELHDLIVELRSLTLGVGTFAQQVRPLQELTGQARREGDRPARRQRRRNRPRGETPYLRRASRKRELGAYPSLRPNQARVTAGQGDADTTQAAAGSCPRARRPPRRYSTTAAGWSKAMAAGPILAARAVASGAAAAPTPIPRPALYPAKRNPNYKLDRPLTDEKSRDHLQQFLRVRHRQGHRRRGAGAADPALDDHHRRHGREADDHRHRRSPEARCRWRSGSIATAASRPGRWRCRGPASRSKRWSIWRSRSARPNICRWQTFMDPSMAPGQKQFWYPWPYIEGLTMAEATNDLAFLVTGMYGKPVPQAGRRAAAPGDAVEIRLQVGQVDRQVQLHRQAAGRRSGRRCRRANTASGPTSIPRCRIRAGARRPSACSAPTTACRP